MQRLWAEGLTVVEVRADAADQLSASAGLYRTVSRSGVVLTVFNREIFHGWPAAPTRVDRDAVQQPFFFQYAKMVAGRVDVNVSGRGKGFETLPGMPLNSVEQSEPATFCQAPVIGDFARHAGIIRTPRWLPASHFAMRVKH